MQNFNPNQGASNLWEGVIKAKNILSSNVMVVIGNGKDTLFWLDSWLLNEPIINYALIDIGVVEKSRSYS